MSLSYPSTQLLPGGFYYPHINRFIVVSGRGLELTILLLSSTNLNPQRLKSKTCVVSMGKRILACPLGKAKGNIHQPPSSMYLLFAWFSHITKDIIRIHVLLYILIIGVCIQSVSHKEQPSGLSNGVTNSLCPGSSYSSVFPLTGFAIF